MKYLDINQDLFKRYRPDKKRDIIELADTKYMLNLSEASIVRMIKETGSGSRTCKTLTLHKHVSNSWNAAITSVHHYKNKVFINGYVDGSNTDRNFSVAYNPVRIKGTLESSVEDPTKHGVLTRTFIFNTSYVVDFLKELCNTYINNKYGPPATD